MDEKQEYRSSFFDFATRFLTGAVAGTLLSILFMYTCRFFVTIDDIPDSHNVVYFFGLHLGQIRLVVIALPLAIGIFGASVINDRSRLVPAIGALIFEGFCIYVAWRMFISLCWMAWEMGID